APRMTAGMIVPAFSSYGDTGPRTEARRYSGGRAADWTAPGVVGARPRSAGLVGAADSAPARRAAGPAAPRSKAANPIGAAIALRRTRSRRSASDSSTRGAAASSRAGGPPVARGGTG